MLTEAIKGDPMTPYKLFETEVINLIKGKPIPEVASFIHDNNHGANFYLYYLIFYSRLVLDKYYTKGLGEMKFRPILQGIFHYRVREFLNLLTDIYKLRDTFLPESYYFLKDYDRVIANQGNSDIDTYDEDDYLKFHPEDRQRVQNLRDDAYQDIFVYREFKEYESSIREEVDCKDRYYSYIVPKLYESYTWTGDKLAFFADDLLDFFNNPPDSYGTFFIDNNLHTLIASIINQFSGLARRFDQLVETRVDRQNSPFSKPDLEKLKTISAALKHHFSESTLTRWEQFRLFYSHSGNRWIDSDHNPFNPSNSPTNKYRGLKLLHWIE